MPSHTAILIRLNIVHSFSTRHFIVARKQHVHSLEDKLSVPALHGQHSFVAKKIGAFVLNEIADPWIILDCLQPKDTYITHPITTNHLITHSH